MGPETRIRKVAVGDMTLRLGGVSEGVARTVADALPAAIRAEMGASGAPSAGPLRQADGSAEAVTRSLAREIAARLRAEMARGRDGEG